MTEFEKKLSKLTAEQSRVLSEHLNDKYNKTPAENPQVNKDDMPEKDAFNDNADK